LFLKYFPKPGGASARSGFFILDGELVEPMNIPKQIRAGDTTTWNESLSGYPSSDYNLFIKLSGTNQITITAAPNGMDYTVTITSTVSNAWVAGQYNYAAYVVDKATSLIRVTIESGSLEILQNLVALTGTQEGRSFARQVLEAIEATLLDRATKEQESLTVPGTASPQLKLLSHDELLRQYYKWKRIVVDEDRAEKIANGKDPGGRVLFRFSPTS